MINASDQEIYGKKANKHVDSSQSNLLICDDTVLAKTRRQKIEQVKHATDARWSVEVYHREIKQICGIKRC